MKKASIVIIILIVIFSITGYLGYNKYQDFMESRPIEINEIVANSEKIVHKSYDITHSFLDGKIKKHRAQLNTNEIIKAMTGKGNSFEIKRNVSNGQENLQTIITKDNKLNIQSETNVTINILTSEKDVVFKGSALELKDFVFNKQDDYLVTVSQQYKDKYGTGTVDYLFAVEVQQDPKVAISNEKPKQGELVKVEVTGVYKDTKVSVEGEFLPSHSFYNQKGGIEIYLPITYFKPAQPYEMSIKIDDKVTPFTLDVQKAEFSQVHFTVSESVSNSTVNSAAANIEYRNKIHPLYKTMDSNKYWSGKFIKPVQEKRISSTFGQERYVNNAKTPKRHSGIDYAAPEGTPVYATNSGKVEFSEFVQLTGNTIVIDHGLGVKSYHFHLSELDVKNGDIVKQGQLIGKVGTTGYSTGPHLHFQMSIQNQPINPEMMYDIDY